MCSLRCLPRPPFHRKALSQIEHYKGFSPICLLKCLPRPPFHRGALSQKLYYKGFLPVCIIIFKRKNLSHSQDALLWHLISMYFQVSLRCSLNKKKQAYQNSSIGMVSSPNVSSCDFKVLPQFLQCYSI